MFNFEFSCFDHDTGILFEQTVQPRQRSCETRCVVVAALLVFWIFLNTRRAFRAFVVSGSPTSDNFWFSSSLLVFFCIILFVMLFDCIPQLPALVQIVVTVRACSNASARFILLFIFLSVLFLCNFRLFDFYTNQTPICRRRSRLLRSFRNF